MDIWNKKRKGSDVCEQNVWIFFSANQSPPPPPHTHTHTHTHTSTDLSTPHTIMFMRIKKRRNSLTHARVNFSQSEKTSLRRVGVRGKNSRYSRGGGGGLREYPDAVSNYLSIIVSEDSASRFLDFEVEALVSLNNLR